MATLNIANNTFDGGASVVRNLYEAPKDEALKEVDFEQIVKELQEIKIRLQEGSQEFLVVDTLEKSSKDHNLSGISSAICGFASQFTSSALANLAGVYLSHLFNLV